MQETTINCNIESIVGADNYQTFATALKNAADIDPSLEKRFSMIMKLIQRVHFWAWIAYINDEAVRCIEIAQRMRYE